MRAVFITEGKEDIGFGHVTRCLGISRAFEEKNIETLLIINGDNSILNLLKKENYKIIDWIKDEGKLLNIIKKDDIVFIDSYLANKFFYEKISKLVKQVIYIDDNNRLPYPKGIVLNGNIYAASLSYPKKKDQIYLLGPKYAPIREEFWDSSSKEINKKVKNILITFGGDDKRNLTPKVLSVLQKNYPDLFFRVIIGNGFKSKSKVKILKTNKSELIIDPNPTQIKELMLKSDMAISASGQTTLELLRLRIPTVIIVVADNQENIASFLSKKNLVEYCGNWREKLLLNKLNKKFKKLESYETRKRMSELQQNIVDGQGARRIVDFLVKVVIRKANMKDIDSVLKISNQTEVRKSSFYSGKISIKNHKKWFKNKLKDKNYIFFVTEISNQIAGQVRAEIVKEKALISISVSDIFRNQKIGYNMVTYLLKYLKLNKPSIKRVVSEIKVENLGSINFFESLGFKYSREINVGNNNAKEYIYIL